MLIDTHIHVGQFNDLYFAPSFIHELMEQLNVAYYAVSSTTQCEENYPKVLSEMKELIRMDGEKVIPVMWVTPDALCGNVAWYLESDIKWRMIKIHPFLSPTAWKPSGTLIEEVLEIARGLHLPLLIHTGNDPSCNSGQFAPVISSNPDLTFILAHGRPKQEALLMAGKYPNVYIDTAFMPIEDIMEFIDIGLSYKLLWGSDLCIHQYFDRNLDVVKYYNRQLEKLKAYCSDEQYQQITHLNAQKILKVS